MCGYPAGDYGLKILAEKWKVWFALFNSALNKWRMIKCIKGERPKAISFLEEGVSSEGIYNHYNVITV